ncbi:MAG: SPASM domain-containing protein, partial [Pseudobdellovibrionaceae bacterium]
KLLFRNRQELGPISAQGVFGPYNSDPLKAYQFYRNLGVDSFDFHFDQESSDENASQEFVEKMQKVAEIAFTEEGEQGLRKIKFFGQLFKQLDSKTRQENFCGSGKTYLVLDAKNNAFTCPWAVNNPEESVGSGTDLDPNRLQPLKNSLISTNNCDKCWAKYLCGGGCMWAHKKATGDRHKVDIVYCERTRALISTGILYYYKLRKV